MQQLPDSLLIACVHTAEEIVETPCDGYELQTPIKEVHLNDGSVWVDLPWDVAYPHPDRRIASFHDYEKTPDDLESLFERMRAQSAALYKIATYARTGLDALRMLAFVKKMRACGHPLIGLCMGEEGEATRVLSPIVGNVWNYASVRQPVASGQLSLQQLHKDFHYDRLTPKTQLYALIGNPVRHSKSVSYHNRLFQQEGTDAVFVKLLLEEEELGPALFLMKQLGFSGACVTTPFKRKILPYLDQIDPEAAEIGAINTLLFTAEGIKGFNTDGKGALDALQDSVQEKRIAVLGAGGAARAIAFEANNRGAQVTLYTRERLKMGPLDPYDIIINATPDPCPINPETLLPGKTLLEITTRFTDTPLIQAAQIKNYKIHLGVEMFQKQAEYQREIFSVVPKNLSQ